MCLALKKRYRGRYFWGIGNGVWSASKITDEMEQEYLEHYRMLIKQKGW